MDPLIQTSTYISHLVYIAGIKVPCLGVTVAADTQTGVINMNIVLPPHESLLELGRLDKVQVAVFYLDSWYYKNNPTWCLLAEGYIATVQYSNTPSKKEVLIQAYSNSNIINTLYLEFLGGGESSSGRVAKSDSNEPNELSFKGKFPGQLFTVGLDNKTQIRAPYELIQNILLATTGVYKDKDVAKSADKKEVEAELARVNSLVELNYNTKIASMTETEKKAFDDSLRQQLQSRANSKNSKVDLNSNVLDLQKSIIKSELESILKERSLNSRTAVTSGFFNRFFNLTRMSKHIVASPVLEGLIDVDKEDKKPGSMPSGVFPMLRTSRGSQYLKALVRQSGIKYGDQGSARSLITNLFGILGYTFSEIISPPIFEADDRGLAIGKFNPRSNSNYLGSFITRPSSNFTIPPACNIIFPSMRLSLNAANNYETMPSRVYYKKSSQGRKLNLDNKTGNGYAHMDSRVGYPAVIAKHAIDSAKAVRGELELLVFPEEYYSGPKAQYVEMNPLLQEIDKLEKAGRLVDETAKIAASTVSPADVGFLRADQTNYYKEAFLSAKNKGQNNYDLYMKQAKMDYDSMRSQASTCNISCVFNPYIVPGFSCIVADQESIGAHLIGTVLSVSHNVYAVSSSTTIVLGSVRRLKSVVEDILLDGGLYDMSPLEPTSEVRSVLQKMEAANYYYANLLYRDSADSITNDKATLEFFSSLGAIRNKQIIAQNEIELLEVKNLDKDKPRIEELNKKLAEYEEEISKLVEKSKNTPAEIKLKAVCDYRKLFGLEDRSKSTTEAPAIKDLNIGNLLREYTTTSTSQNTRVELLSDFSKLKLVYKNNNAKLLANSYEASMDYVSRPVCTLEQYIDFYRQSDSPELSAALGGRGRGVRIRPSYLNDATKIGKHYEIIREFVGGPGLEPGSKSAPKQDSLELRFISEGPNNSAIRSVFSTIKPGEKASVTSLPDTIKDWQELLLDYIEDIKRSGVLQ